MVLLDNLRACNALVCETIGQFTDEAWVQVGVNRFQTPVMIANHIAETLAYFFRDDPDSEWDWGWPFRDKWELAEQQLPSQRQVLEFLDTTMAHITAKLSVMDDSALSEPYSAAQADTTRLSRYIYAIRHTMHHHGALSLLALQSGAPDGHWE